VPELPEVEVVRRGLEQSVPGRTFRAVTVRRSDLRFPVPSEKLQTLLPGAKICEVNRRGKFLLLQIDNGHTLLVHLGMSGRFLLVASNHPLDKHDHVLFSLDENVQLRFRDPRRFGMLDLWPTAKLEQHPRLQHLGPEPFSASFSPAYARERAGVSRRSIKSWLLDATFVAGIGNIYASESLYRAKIHPGRSAASLNETEWNRLIHAVRMVLNSAIRQGGTTLQDEGFRNILNLGGRFQLYLHVYGKEGLPCPSCGTPIRRILQQGRSTYFCPKCQKE